MLIVRKYFQGFQLSAGFSLVELSVVLICLAIVLGIALPRLGHLRQSAQLQKLEQLSRHITSLGETAQARGQSLSALQQMAALCHQGYVYRSGWPRAPWNAHIYFMSAQNWSDLYSQLRQAAAAPALSWEHVPWDLYMEQGSLGLAFLHLPDQTNQPACLMLYYEKTP